MGQFISRRVRRSSSRSSMSSLGSACSGSGDSTSGESSKSWWKWGRRKKDSSNHKLLTTEDFFGIVRIELVEAQMPFKEKWFACVSLGEQTFRTKKSDKTENPKWNSEKKVVLERNGPRIVRISVFQSKRRASTLMGYTEVDLSIGLNEDIEHSAINYDLVNPTAKSTVIGRITLSYNMEDRVQTERDFARRILTIVDYDGNGELSFPEFHDLIKAFGNKMSDEKLKLLFEEADENHDGKVSADELASLLAIHKEKTVLIKRCPVCGELFNDMDSLNDMIHMSLCFDEGTGHEIMTGGFLTEKQASHGWMFKLSEWASLSTYDVGLKEGKHAAHILVFDRRTKGLIEEIIDQKIVLAMRAIYQSKFGLALLDAGTKNLLLSISQKQGKRMDAPESALQIPQFVEFFKDRIDIDEFKYPIEQYKTFNEFFTRELKPGARPIAHCDNDAVAVCAADSRLMAFNSTTDATRFWIKGRKFSVKGLLVAEDLCQEFDGGPIVIFRLAPQDYHRFHAPVSGVISSLSEISGHLFTVNPIAVNSKYCNVFTENKRVVTIIDTKEFGKVAFIAIGATMVGSIHFLKSAGDTIQKGDEFGYFSFGGSTCICLFKKDAIDLDEDILANSERSLETLVSVGMTLGISENLLKSKTLLRRPSIKESVVALNNAVARDGVLASTGFNVRNGHLGVTNDEMQDEA